MGIITGVCSLAGKTCTMTVALDVSGFSVDISVASTVKL